MSLRGARRHDLRLIPVAGITWLGAAVAVWLPEHATAAACASVALCSLAVVALLRSTASLTAGLLAIGLAFAAAAAAHVAIAETARDAVRDLPTTGGRTIVVDADVVGKVERRGRGWIFDAVASRVSIGGGEHRTSVPLTVTLDEPPADLDLGASVAVTGTAAPADRGDRAVIEVRAAEVDVRAPPQGVWSVASGLRRGLQTSAASLPQPASGLIAGLAVGDTSEVTGDLDADMKASSLSHLTAVSGANCALIVAIAFGCAAAFGAARVVRVAAGMGALAGFVVLVSPEPSVVRAAAMASIAMTALLLGRTGAGVAVLCLAVMILLLVDPWLSTSLGFALSCAATASLLLAAAPLTDGLQRWMPKPIALMIAVPLSAQLACGPLLALITPTVPLYGVAANLLAGPAAPAATVLGLLACLTAAVPLIGAGLVAIAWLPAAWIAGTASTMTHLPGNAVPWIEGWAGFAALLVVGAATLAVLVRSGPLTRFASAGAIALACVAGAVLAAGPLVDVVERGRTPRAWTIAACDVGQGDAVLVRSRGRVALIDTGPAPEPLAACLDRFGVERVDLLVLTHFDLDHRGGLPAVQGRIAAVVHARPEDPKAAGVVAGLSRDGAQTTEAHAGMTGTLGGAAWRVLWPAAPGSSFEGNAAGVVVEFGGGGVPRTLLLADLSAEPQIALAPQLTATYDIVKVAHHGSADQYDGLYRKVAARLAIVSVGDNDYGHPRDEILDVLRSGGATIARTDRGGAIAVWRGASAAPDAAPGAARLQVWHEREVGPPG
jgi:competence protein ComEC